VRRCIAGLAACATLAAAAADEPRWYLQLDNDAGFDTDRWYSSGLRLARVQQHEDHALEMGLLHEVYTPEAKFFAPGRVERRPAARLLLFGARHDVTDAHFQTLEVAAGVRGPGAQGKRLTDLIHRVIDARFVDWDRQGANRFDVQLAGVRTQAFGMLRTHYGAVLGSQLAFAHGGLELRIGDGAIIDSPVMRYAATPPMGLGRAIARGWSGFVGVNARAVARNQLFDQGYDAFAPPPQREKVVGRVAAGASASLGWGMLVFTLVQETREHEAQRTPHRFGSLAIHALF
jgi:hypothetical protein